MIPLRQRGRKGGRPTLPAGVLRRRRWRVAGTLRGGRSARRGPAVRRAGVHRLPKIDGEQGQRRQLEHSGDPRDPQPDRAGGGRETLEQHAADVADRQSGTPRNTGTIRYAIPIIIVVMNPTVSAWR